MVYWINGPYGVGKSTVAEVLQKKLPNLDMLEEELRKIHEDSLAD